MGFIKAGFTGGFLGIVISITSIFTAHPIVEKLASIGFYVASQFGKVCINTLESQCSLSERFTTIIASIVGNTIAYFVIFALISLAISLIVMWLTPSRKEEVVVVQQPQIIQQPQVQQVQQPQVVKVVERVVEKRPVKKAKVRKKK
ncbi:MAG: hypothetical protein ACP5N7_02175 [Candidatus Pacearchaeota archaeon]